MKLPVVVLLTASILLGCSTDHPAKPEQGLVTYDPSLTRSKIVSTLPPGWSLIPHQDRNQHWITSEFFTDPRGDAFILVGPRPNYIDWTDKQGTPHREYLAKECLYIWTMPGAFKPKFQHGFKVGPPPPLVSKSQGVQVYGRASQYIADTNRFERILKEVALISSPEVRLSWADWRRDLATGVKK